ncbi:ABC transporter permease [Rhodosalinus sp. FB01]|uniref:ABC transporter permease n=1 Tax=Rhodosalinus sp. FB01 TaxID=3239194 RepID=UPI0035269D17
MTTIALIVLCILPAPLIFVAWVSFSGEQFLRVPPGSYSVRWYAEFLSSPKWMFAFGTSILLGLVVAVITTATALFAALAAMRMRGSSRGWLELLIMLPLLFPAAAMAIAMRAVNDQLGINATFLGVMIAHVVLCGPFAYRPISANLRALDPATSEAAMSLGATPVYTLWRVILPQLKPGLITSLWFSFIISFDEVNITMFLVGINFTTLPVQTYAHLADSGDPIVAAISVFLILITLLLVLLLQRTVGLKVLVNSEDRMSELQRGKT